MTKRNSKATYYAIWATAWGPMGAVASPAGLSRVVLPHYQVDDLQQLLSWEHPGAVCDEGPFEQLIELSRGYFNAGRIDFGEIACGLPAAESFSGLVYCTCRQIPYGQTQSYSELARRIGRLDAARAVAGTMSRNPLPLVVPCHRVIYADGRLGGFSAAGGQQLKCRMLELEKQTSQK